MPYKLNQRQVDFLILILQQQVLVFQDLALSTCRLHSLSANTEPFNKLAWQEHSNLLADCLIRIESWKSVIKQDSFNNIPFLFGFCQFTGSLLGIVTKLVGRQSNPEQSELGELYSDLIRLSD